MKKNCQICSAQFESNVWNKKFCSNECFKKNGLLRQKNRIKNLKLSCSISSKCVHCNKEFIYLPRKGRKERIFCGRSCASKFYIENGKFEKWRLMKMPKNGIQEKCINEKCENLVYLEKRFINSDRKGKACSKKCKNEYMRQIFTGEGNPMFGKKLSEDQKRKQKETLCKNYPGIKNAFSLSKKRTKTKGQIKIFEFVSKNYPEFNFQIEKRVCPSESKEFYADIISFDKKVVIEFNGDYWHCNPQKYDENFFHQVKKKKASEIWEQDKKRVEIIKSFGYNVLVIWESHFRLGDWREKILKWVEENEKENNLNAL
jgi:very-short-patch-repair endonuclease